MPKLTETGTGSLARWAWRHSSRTSASDMPSTRRYPSISSQYLAFLAGIAALTRRDATFPRRLCPVCGGGSTVQSRLLALGGCLVPEQRQTAALAKVDRPRWHLPLSGLGTAVTLVCLAVTLIGLAVSFIRLAI